MAAALLILAKDLRQRVRDRTVWILGLVAPLALAGVLGVVIGDFTSMELPPPAWGVVDADDGDIGASLTAGVLPAVASELDAEITTFPDRSAGMAALEDGELDALFVTPPGLTDAVFSLGNPTVEVVGQISGSIQHQVAISIVDQWSLEVEVRRNAAIVAAATGASFDPSAVQAVVVPRLLEATDLGAADRTLDGSTYVAVGMAIFFLFFTVQLGVLGLLEERANGTLPRLRAAPVPTWSVIVGKVLTSVVIGWLATVVLIAASTLFLGASWGPTWPILVLVTCAVLAAVSLVTVVAGFTDNVDTAQNASGVIGIVLGMLGGAFFPIATQPGLLATLSDLTPHGMFITAVGDLAVPGAGVGDIVPQLLGLLTFAAAVSVGASGFLRLRGGL